MAALARQMHEQTQIARALLAQDPGVTGAF
jgi:hypothetical protein